VSQDPPAITVVIPTRNRGALIAETIQSLRRVEYPAFAVLVVDQSTDARTREAVQAAPKPNRIPKELGRTVSLGQYLARNR